MTDSEVRRERQTDDPVGDDQYRRRHHLVPGADDDAAERHLHRVEDDERGEHVDQIIQPGDDGGVLGKRRKYRVGVDSENRTRNERDTER